MNGPRNSPRLISNISAFAALLAGFRDVPWAPIGRGRSSVRSPKPGAKRARGAGGLIRGLPRHAIKGPARHPGKRWLRARRERLAAEREARS